MGDCSINRAAAKVICQRAELVEMDYSEGESISKAINGIDKLFSLPYQCGKINQPKKIGRVHKLVLNILRRLKPQQN
jgi:hypothetical protein